MEDSPCSEHSTTTPRDDDGSRPAVWLLEKDTKAKREEKNLRHADCDSVRSVCCRCDKTERAGTGQPPVIAQKNVQLPRQLGVVYTDLCANSSNAV